MPGHAIFKGRWKGVRRLGRALRLVYDSGHGWMAASVALLVVRGLVPLFLLYLTKLLIDAVTVAMQPSHAAGAVTRVEVLIGLSGLVALVDTCCRSLAVLVGEAQGLSVADHVYHLMQVRSVELDLAFYENVDFYDTFHRAQQEATYRCLRVASGLAQTVQNGLSVIAVAGLILSFNWLIGLAVVASTVPTFLVRLRAARGLYDWKTRRTFMERHAAYLHSLITGAHHAKELRLFGLGGVFIARYQELRSELRTGSLALAVRRCGFGMAAQIINVVAVTGASAYIAIRAVHGFLSLGALVMYYGAFQRGQALLQDTMSGLIGVYEDSLYLADIDDFLELQPTLLQPEDPFPVPRPMQSGFAFNNVNFSYPGSSRKVLEDVTLSVLPGQVVALVGENGAGKTSLVKLLCRLYDPDGGSVTLDGVDLREFDSDALRREISVIFQDYSHYNMSVWENIWLGSVGHDPDREKIAAAAHKAGVDKVIQTLPQRYDSILGGWFRNGEELSIGEWQKIALARAFFRDAQLIVMDEPSSAMDAHAEHALFQNLRQLLEGRAAILISHRLSTVKMADHIYVLEGGRVVESGCHEELIRNGGTYASLFNQQASPYR